MRTKIVLRLLDAAGELLGWAETVGVAKGDGCLRVEPVVLIPTRDGQLATVSVHWPDMHIQKVLPHQGGVVAGAQLVFHEFVWTFDSDTGPLPPVTISAPVAVLVPTGAMGAVGTR